MLLDLIDGETEFFLSGIAYSDTENFESLIKILIVADFG